MKIQIGTGIAYYKEEEENYFEWKKRVVKVVPGVEDKGGEAENVSLEGVGQAAEELENSCRCDQWKSVINR